MDNKISNKFFYCLIVLVGLGLTYWFKTTEDGVLKLLLYPHAKAVGIFYNIPLEYISGIGYCSIDSIFSIGRECMGYNFIVLMFAMNSCMFVKYFKGTGKILWILISLVTAVLVGVIVSCIRIIGSVPFVTHEKFVPIHSGMGIAFYFFALAVSYMVIQNLVGRYKLEENY